MFKKRKIKKMMKEITPGHEINTQLGMVVAMKAGIKPKALAKAFAEKGKYIQYLEEFTTEYAKITFKDLGKVMKDVVKTMK